VLALQRGEGCVIALALALAIAAVIVCLALGGLCLWIGHGAARDEAMTGKEQ
jgi:hypothetical protein